ncbi:MAG: hypoxanthine phosphoribosyltransferase [Bacteroidota bacterium]
MSESVQIHDKRFVPYIRENQINLRLQSLAEELNQTYADKAVTLLPVLQGSFIFAADLIRLLDFQPALHFIQLASYGGGLESSGEVKWILPPRLTFKDQHLLIVEDIIDTGLTCDVLMDYLMKDQPASVSICSLLFKEANFKGRYKPDYVGFQIPPDFVLGYGLDYAEKGRELPAIYRIERD